MVLPRVIALWLIVYGWNFQHGPVWRWLVGGAIFLAGTLLDDIVIRYHEQRKLMPHRWNCPVCKNKGSRFRIRATEHEKLAAVREHHLRTVHLMEP